MRPSDDHRTAPHFSKSAPNLEKSRAAAAQNHARSVTGGSSATDLYAATQATVGGSLHDVDDDNGAQQPIYQQHRRALGKSVEVLSPGRNDDGDTNDGGVGTGDNVSGCFGRPTHKKHSLDSTYHLMETNNNAAAAAVASVAANCPPNLDEVPYDRVFYRGIQQSLDSIFGRDDDGHALRLRNDRNSKSFSDLTLTDEGNDGNSALPAYDMWTMEEPIESQFDRECFFRANHESLRSSVSPSALATAAAAAADDEAADDVVVYGDYLKRATIFQRSTESRKNSVTFRSDYEQVHGSGVRVPPPPADDLVRAGGGDTPSQSPRGSLKSALRHNYSQSPNHSHNSSTSTSTSGSLSGGGSGLTTPSALPPTSTTTTTAKPKPQHKSRLHRIARLFKRRDRNGNGSGSQHSNSFYSRRGGELSEQLLSAAGGSDELDGYAAVMNGSRSSAGSGLDGGRGLVGDSVVADDEEEEEEEPTYERIVRTKHFLLARPND